MEKKGIYPEQKRIEAATLYAATGSPETVSELSSVPVNTVKKWRKEDWFIDILKEIRNENNDAIDAKFTEIVEHALDAVKDRLLNGDFVQTAKGELIRKPIPAKDLGYLLAVHIDKRQTIRGEPVARTEVLEKLPEKQLDRLEKLAETFENLARFGRKPKIIDITPYAIPIAASTTVDVQEQAIISEEVGETYSQG